MAKKKAVATDKVEKCQEKENTGEVEALEEKLGKVEVADTEATKEEARDGVEGVEVLGEKTENSTEVRFGLRGKFIRSLYFEEKKSFSPFISSFFLALIYFFPIFIHFSIPPPKGGGG